METEYGLVAIDRDSAAIEKAAPLLEPFKERITVVRENFRNIKEVTGGLGLRYVDGILADLGLSSIQLDDPARGFGFRFDSRLDMRMDRRQAETAFNLVNGLSAKELERLFSEYGEERYSRRIARAIVRARENAPVETTAELSRIIESSVPRVRRKDGVQAIHPATRVFQALRIAVNEELGEP